MVESPVGKIPGTAGTLAKPSVENTPQGVPAYPSDCSPGAPDFVGIGVQKAGTSWWFKALMMHPEIFFPAYMVGQVEPANLPKERHFFDRFATEPFSADCVQEYHRWCAKPRGMITGEWTPRYIMDYWVVPLLKKAAPDAKLLVLLRDPVERFRSGMAHSMKKGIPPQRAASEHCFRGLYHTQLMVWRKYYHREKLLVLQYERCRVDPSNEYIRTTRFLHVSDSFLPPPECFARMISQTKPQTKPNLTDSQLKVLIDLYSPDVEALAREYPEVDLMLWPNFRHLGVTGAPRHR